MNLLDLYEGREPYQQAIDKLEQRRIEDLEARMDDCARRGDKEGFQKAKAERDSYYKVNEAELDEKLKGLPTKKLGTARDVGKSVKKFRAERGLEEGEMKRAMEADAERMSREKFIAKYGDEEWIGEFWDNVNGTLDEAGIGQDIVNKSEKMARATPPSKAGAVASTVKNAAKWLAGKGGPGKEGPTYEDTSDVPMRRASAGQPERPWPGPWKPYIENGRVTGIMGPNGEKRLMSKSHAEGADGMIYLWDDPRRLTAQKKNSEQVKEHYFIHEGVWDNIRRFWTKPPRYRRPTQRTGESDQDFEARVDAEYNKFQDEKNKWNRTSQQQSQGWEGPAHGSSTQELDLFKAGNKPVSIQPFVDPAFKQWKELIDSGRYPTAVLYQNGKPNSVVIGQPNKADDVRKVHKLVQTATEFGERGDFSPYQNPKYHTLLGQLLGYSQSQIDSFLSHYFKNKTNEDSKPRDLAAALMLKKAHAAFPIAKDDAEALALWIADKEQRDVARLERENEQEEEMIARIIDQLQKKDVDEGWQDFNKVEPYAVCLAGRPVKKFDYYEEARRFHDNWKKKLYREGNKEKADKITLMPLGLDEDDPNGGATIAIGQPAGAPADLEEAGSPAQQAAIAIAMKKAGRKPKHVDEAEDQVDPIILKALERLQPGLEGSQLYSAAKEALALEFGLMKARGDATFIHYLNQLQNIYSQRHSVKEDMGSWIVYDPKTKEIRKRFKTHTAGKSYAQTHGLGFASSEYYFDNVKPQAVAEGYDWNMIEKEQLAVIEKIKKSDHSDIVKKYLIAINDPAGAVIKPSIQGHRRKEEQAKEQIRNALAQKYNIDPEEFKKAEDIEDKRVDSGTSIHNVYDSEGQLVAEAPTDYQKRRQRERDVDAGKPVARQRPSKQTDYQKKRAQDKKDMELGEAENIELDDGPYTLFTELVLKGQPLNMDRSKVAKFVKKEVMQQRTGNWAALVNNEGKIIWRYNPNGQLPERFRGKTDIKPPIANYYDTTGAIKPGSPEMTRALGPDRGSNLGDYFSSDTAQDWQDWADEKENRKKPGIKQRPEKYMGKVKTVEPRLGEGDTIRLGAVQPSTAGYDAWYKSTHKTAKPGEKTPTTTTAKSTVAGTGKQDLMPRVVDEEVVAIEENLKKWFKEKWVRFGPDGKIRGDCARGSESEGKPKCLPQSKAHALGKKGRASAAAKKRREDPNPERRGAAKNVATKVKEDDLDEACWKGYHKEGNKELFGKTVPNCVKNEAVAESHQSCPECGGAMYPETMINEKQDACYYKVKSRYKVWPSAYASGALVQCRKKGAANWGNKSKNESAEQELDEKWSQKYKSSINCSNPKGFSQKAHCAGKKKNEGMFSTLGEDNEARDAVESAIIRRILVAHKDLLQKFGPQKVMDAAAAIADDHSDVEEIGTSDVSAYVHEVERYLAMNY